MNEKIIMELVGKSEELVNSIAGALGKTANQVYEILVRFQFAQGISTLIGVVIWALGTTLFAKYVFKRTDNGETTCWATFVFGIFWMITILLLMDGVLRIIAPDYFAIKEILNTIKGGE